MIESVRIENSIINNPIISKKLDNLSSFARVFYERAVFKMFLSVLYGALAMMFLAFCTSSGGNSSSYSILLKSSSVDDDSIKNSYSAVISGYGN